jgi:hypothetical protein
LLSKIKVLSKGERDLCSVLNHLLG